MVLIKKKYFHSFFFLNSPNWDLLWCTDGSQKTIQSQKFKGNKVLGEKRDALWHFWALKGVKLDFFFFFSAVSKSIVGNLSPASEFQQQYIPITIAQCEGKLYFR